MKTKLLAEWKIAVRDKEGKVLKEICKDGDLVLLNWKKLAAAFGIPFQNTSVLSVVDYRGYIQTYSVNYLATNLTGSSGTANIGLGSDTTPPSESDYKLGSEWAKSGNLTITWTNPSPDEWNASISYTFSTSVQRTLSELGVYTFNGYVLLCRDVLPEPITIPAGASVTITYTLKSRSGG
jgi:hypothetical protein